MAPTLTPCPAATTTTVPQGSAIAFHAQALTNNGLIRDITNAASTLWTSDNPSVLSPISGQGGAYSGVSSGCACIVASSGSLSSLPVGVGVVPLAPSPTPTPCLCPTPVATPSSTPVAGAGVLQWTFDAGAPIRGRVAAAADGSAYFIAGGLLHALDRAGHERFRHPAAGFGPVLAPDGTIYIQGTDGQLHALSAGGREQWQVKDGDGPGPLAIAADGTVYAAADSALLAIRPGGELDWRVAIGNVTAAAPASDGGVVAVVAGGRISAFSAHGTERWSFSPAGGFAGGIAIGNDAVYAGSADGVLYALDSNGRELWHVATSSRASSGPAASPDGDIYFVSDRLYSVSPGGTVRWQLDIERAGAAASLILDGDIVVADAGGLAFLVGHDGSYRWGARLNGPVSASPAQAAGQIYIGTERGRLYAIR
ncbi:MAG: PQQ-binding-like beta-propeller repeat protein [Candidatus Binataceae bacterium]